MKIISRKEAKAKGLKWYYTGKQCKRGHIADRLVSNCQCRDCINAKEPEYRERKNAASRRYYARNREYYREYLEKNRDRIKKQRHEYYEKHKQERKAYNREYYQRNKERMNQLSRLWVEKNIQRRREISLKWASRQVKLLGDWYVKNKLCEKNSLRFDDLPPELVELKRLHLQAIRELRERGK